MEQPEWTKFEIPRSNWAGASREDIVKDLTSMVTSIRFRGQIITKPPLYLGENQSRALCTTLQSGSDPKLIWASIDWRRFSGLATLLPGRYYE